MAGVKQGMVTGANAKIKAFDKTLAFCSDVSYNVTVQTIPVEAMGRYEVITNEPVAYMVDGSFSVIRYTNLANEADIPTTSTSGNAIKDMLDSGSSVGGNAEHHMNPKEIIDSYTFDLEIFQKQNDSNETEVFRIKDCRITRRSMSLNKRGIYVDNYAFVGVLAGDETATQISYTPGIGIDGQ